MWILKIVCLEEAVAAVVGIFGSSGGLLSVFGRRSGHDLMGAAGKALLFA